MYVCLESLYPDSMDDRASAKNAKKAMLMAADDASVKMLSAPCRMRFVIGIAADAAEISK